MTAGAGFELVLHDERNDENLDELLFELFNDEFDNITLNLFDRCFFLLTRMELRKMASQVGACLSKTVRDVQGKPAKGRGEVFYPR